MKMTPFRTLLPGLASVLLLVACLDGGGGDSPPAPPVAVIQASVDGAPVTAGGTVETGSVVTLDASTSTTTVGSLSYQWNLPVRPDGATATIDTPTAATASLAVELPGSYLVRLTADNGTTSASTELEIAVTSELPIARVDSALLTTLVGQVQLDGRASLPPTGGDAAQLEYQWSLVSVPPGSALTAIPLAEARLSQPRFTTDIVGRYEVDLQVSHEGKASRAPARVQIDVTPPHTVPIAVIREVGAAPYLRGEAIHLDAGDSTPGGDSAGLQYRWTVTPPCSGACQGFPLPPQVSNADQREMSFIAQRASTYAVSLQVYDGISLSAPVTRSITVVKPDSAENTAPVAAIYQHFGMNTFEIEWGADQALNHAAYDIDEANANILVREWTMLRPATHLSDFNTATNRFRPSLEPPVDGFVEYEFQLRVQDPQGVWSEPVTQVYRVLRGANRTPTANAASTTGLPTTMTGREVTLTAERSSDPDNNRLSYDWTLVDRPDGSQATLRNASQLRSAFTPDQPGNYVVSLWVTDEHGSRSITPFRLGIFAKSVNHPPQARPETPVRFTEEQPFVIGIVEENVIVSSAPVRLDADQWIEVEYRPNAFDPDGDTLQLLWTMTEAPSATALGWYWGHLAQCPVGGPALIVLPGGGFITNPFTQERLDAQLPAREWTDCRDGILKFAPVEAGRYEVNLQASDGSVDIGPFAFTLHAVERANYPGLLLEEDRTIGSIPSGSAPYRQVVFPVEPASGDGRALPNHNRNLWNGNRGNTLVSRAYRMTAVDRDYTIQNLSASSEYPGVDVRFAGLSNGQVISRGEEITFTIEYTVPPAEAGELPPAGEEFDAIGRGIRWAFDVAERPGWSFALTQRAPLQP